MPLPEAFVPQSDPHRAALLVVDGDPDVLRALAFMADTRGYDVRRCASVEAALRATDQGFACLIIEQNLPDGRGLDLLRELRARGVRTPAVLMTTNPTATFLKRAVDAGAPIVEKPLLGEELFTEIRRLTTV